MNLRTVLLITLLALTSLTIGMSDEERKLWRDCVTCVDKDFFKFTPLYRNDDIGRDLETLDYDGMNGCKNGQIPIRTRCRDACMRVAIRHVLPDGRTLTHLNNYFFDCSTNRVNYHTAIKNHIDSMHIREDMTIIDPFEQIHKVVEYTFTMDSIDEQKMREMMGMPGGVEKSTEIKENGKVSAEKIADNTNMIVGIVFFSSLFVLTIFAVFWHVITEKCITLLKCCKSRQIPDDINQEEVNELQSRINNQ